MKTAMRILIVTLTALVLVTLFAASSVEAGHRGVGHRATFLGRDVPDTSSGYSSGRDLTDPSKSPERTNMSPYGLPIPRGRTTDTSNTGNNPIPGPSYKPERWSSPYSPPPSYSPPSYSPGYKSSPSDGGGSFAPSYSGRRAPTATYSSPSKYWITSPTYAPNRPASPCCAPAPSFKRPYGSGGDWSPRGTRGW